ncbi:hypothetical protein IKE82_00010 [Candidatus Saccharibacteria bacterium]|nr:hypothetical protein [Candidatus Saccharibacteria bacterium]
MAQEKNKKKKRWILFTIVGVALVCIVVLAIVLVITISRNEEIKSRRTVLTELYEQLGDEMTFGELENKTKTIAPSAEISFEDGTCIIGNDVLDDYITCEIKNEEEAVSNEVENNVNIDELIAKVLTEPDTDDEEEETEEEVDEVVSPSDPNMVLPDSTVMIDFTYYAYNTPKNDEDDANLMSISEKDNGYDYNNGISVIRYQTKTAAIDALLRRL